jgi:hypothetical protein
VAERAFVALRLARVNAAFDHEFGVGQNHVQSGQDAYHARVILSGKSKFSQTAR